MHVFKRAEIFHFIRSDHKLCANASTFSKRKKNTQNGLSYNFLQKRLLELQRRLISSFFFFFNFLLRISSRLEKITMQYSSGIQNRKRENS